MISIIFIFIPGSVLFATFTSNLVPDNDSTKGGLHHVEGNGIIRSEAENPPACSKCTFRFNSEWALSAALLRTYRSSFSDELVLAHSHHVVVLGSNSYCSPH